MESMAEEVAPRNNASAPFPPPPRKKKRTLAKNENVAAIHENGEHGGYPGGNIEKDNGGSSIVVSFLTSEDEDFNADNRAKAKPDQMRSHQLRQRFMLFSLSFLISSVSMTLSDSLTRWSLSQINVRESVVL